MESSKKSKSTKKVSISEKKLKPILKKAKEPVESDNDSEELPVEKPKLKRTVSKKKVMTSSDDEEEEEEKPKSKKSASKKTEKPKSKKGSKPNAWLEFVKEYRAKHPKLEYKVALKKAAESYKKQK